MMEFIHNLIDAISTCCLNCRDHEAASGESTERSPLLQQQDQRNQSLQIRRISENDDFSTSYPRDIKDEQTALSRIVQETNTNIIDVAALDAHHMLEQSEYNDRLKIYQHRLTQQWNSIPVSETNYNGLLMDIPNPEYFLSIHPSSEELTVARNFIKDASQAINDMKVVNQEDLVVPFQI